MQPSKVIIDDYIIRIMASKPKSLSLRTQLKIICKNI